VSSDWRENSGGAVSQTTDEVHQSNTNLQVGGNRIKSSCNQTSFQSNVANIHQAANVTNRFRPHKWGEWWG
jgi:hypothetical protein